eukprot:3561908-Prymnesium_polylepis.1
MSSPSTTSPPPSSPQNARRSSAARSADLVAAGSVWAAATSAEKSGTWWGESGPVVGGDPPLFVCVCNACVRCLCTCTKGISGHAAPQNCPLPACAQASGHPATQKRSCRDNLPDLLRALAQPSTPPLFTSGGVSTCEDGGPFLTPSAAQQVRPTSADRQQLMTVLLALAM